MLELIDPKKDADGLHPENLGKLVMNTTGKFDSPLPCTPNGIIELLRRHGVETKGAEVAVIGRGLTVGRPLGLLLSNRGVDATPTLLHSASNDIAGVVRRSDIVVAASQFWRLQKMQEIHFPTVAALAGAVLVSVASLALLR